MFLDEKGVEELLDEAAEDVGAGTGLSAFVAAPTMSARTFTDARPIITTRTVDEADR